MRGCEDGPFKVVITVHADTLFQSFVGLDICPVHNCDTKARVKFPSFYVRNVCICYGKEDKQFPPALPLPLSSTTD